MNNVLPFPLPPRTQQPTQQPQMRQQSPMQAIVDQFMTGMSPMSILERMGGPQVNQAKRIIGGKSERQLRDIAMNMARQRGVDLGSLAQQLGVRLPE